LSKENLLWTGSENAMPKLSPADITEFKEIYKTRYGRDLSDEDAYRLASRLLNLYEAVYLSPRLNDETPGDTTIKKLSGS
jgi:hypothetical protein